jgi:hypothetical protein
VEQPFTEPGQPHRTRLFPWEVLVRFGATRLARKAVRAERRRQPRRAGQAAAGWLGRAVLAAPKVAAMDDPACPQPPPSTRIMSSNWSGAWTVSRLHYHPGHCHDHTSVWGCKVG